MRCPPLFFLTHLRTKPKLGSFPNPPSSCPLTLCPRGHGGHRWPRPCHGAVASSQGPPGDARSGAKPGPPIPSRCHRRSPWVRDMPPIRAALLKLPSPQAKWKIPKGKPPKKPLWGQSRGEDAAPSPPVRPQPRSQRRGQDPAAALEPPSPGEQTQDFLPPAGAGSCPTVPFFLPVHAGGSPSKQS